VAEVRLAPLRSLRVDGEDYRWYDTAAVEDLDGIDLLLVDGPPAAVGPLARYPAVPRLESKLSPTATIILDDAARSDERQILMRWTENRVGLRQERPILDRLAVLTYERPTG